jgi:glycosyltransferase involved in cell wall biosynthesis
LDPHLATRAGFPALQGHFRTPNKEFIDGIPYYRLEGRELGGASYDEIVEQNAKKLGQLAERLRPSVLHPTTNYMNAQAAFAARNRVGVPTVYEVRGFLEKTWLVMRDEESVDSEQIRMVRAVETRCMEEADAVVTLSQSMAKEITSRGVNCQKITVVPNAVDPDEFCPSRADRSLRRQMGISEHTITIGYVTSLVRYEGVQFLLKSIAHLLNTRQDVCGVVVGEGPERRSLENQAAELGVGKSVVFTGRVPYRDILSYYGAIDIFVVPRTSDRVCKLVSPLKPLEAMAMECPIVVSDLPPLRELVECGAGETFEPENSVDLARTLLPLIEDRALRGELGSNGRQWILQERTWRKTALLYRELYEQLGAET